MLIAHLRLGGGIVADLIQNTFPESSRGGIVQVTEKLVEMRGTLEPKVIANLLDVYFLSHKHSFGFKVHTVLDDLICIQIG